MADIPCDERAWCAARAALALVHGKAGMFARLAATATKHSPVRPVRRDPKNNWRGWAGAARMRQVYGDTQIVIVDGNYFYPA
jgi:hypothetical protein